MAGGMTNLVDVLKARSASMEKMRQLLEEERQSILAFDTERLREAVARKVEVATVMEELDGTCRTLLKQEGARHGLTGTVTLSPLIACTPKPAREELASLQETLAARAEELRGMIADNRRLLESSLATVGRSLAFFQSRFTVAETYGGTGRMVERSAGSGLLRKEL